MGPNRVHVVLDYGDTRECSEAIGAMHDLERGCVVVRPSPPIGAASLARDVLQALGKRLDLPESPSQRADASDLASLWLAAENVRRLFVMRAHLLNYTALRHLLSMLSPVTDAYLISATAVPTTAINELLPGAYGICELDRVVKLREADQDLCEPENPSWPPVPDTEFWSFRATARDLLSDADFAQLDAEMYVGRLAAHEWIDQRATVLYGARFEEREVRAFLTGLLAPATAPEQALARIRGAQCAFFLSGTLVELSAHALPQSTPPAFTPLDRRAATLLRGFASPRLAAAGVLALACQMPPRQLRRIDLLDLHRDAEHAVVSGLRIPIPPYARGLLRAQRLARNRDRAEMFHPLFADPKSPAAPITPAAMAANLKRIAKCTGLALLPDRVIDDESPPARWVAADALTVTALESLGHREQYA